MSTPLGAAATGDCSRRGTSHARASFGGAERQVLVIGAISRVWKTVRLGPMGNRPHRGAPIGVQAGGARSGNRCGSRSGGWCGFVRRDACGTGGPVNGLKCAEMGTLRGMNKLTRRQSRQFLWSGIVLQLVMALVGFAVGYYHSTHDKWILGAVGAAAGMIIFDILVWVVGVPVALRLRRKQNQVS